MKVGFSMEDEFCLSNFSVGINQNATRLRLIRPPSHVGVTTGFKMLASISSASYYFMVGFCLSILFYVL